MSIESFYLDGRRLAVRHGPVPAVPQSTELSRCLVRNGHPCVKSPGVSKSCFIACPPTDCETLLALISEKLARIGIEPVIASRERAYGQDVFCTKICGRIIESQFCIVVLDDARRNVGEQSDPNVYYEYGLMTALNKHVIPLHKEGQLLAFNVRTLDAIRYTPQNLSAELDAALEDALKATRDNRAGDSCSSELPVRLLKRCLEMNGFRRRNNRWALADDLEDTYFEGYDFPEGDGYLFFAILKERSSVLDAVTDMSVVAKRLRSRIKRLPERRDGPAAEAEDIRTERKNGHCYLSPAAMKKNIDRLTRDQEDADSYIARICSSGFAVVLAPDIAGLRQQVETQYTTMGGKVLAEPLPLYVGDMNSIRIRDLQIDFKLPQL